MKKIKIKSFILSLFIFVFFNSCKTRIIKYDGKSDIAFKEYLKVSNIEYKELNDSIYSKYYSKYLKDELKQKFDKNPYLKTNQVYVHYRTNDSVEFSVYSDEGVFCFSTFDLDMDGKILSIPKNGIVKVLHPVPVEFFGDFELINDFIRTRKRSKTPFNEWYDYVNGSIKNDTIHFTEKYVGTNDHKFRKKWLAKLEKKIL
jgi:hypothetical protein